MGNTPSRPPPSLPAGGHAASAQVRDPSVVSSNNPPPPRREPRRRDSIQALSSGKATAAPPSESLTSALAHSSLQPPSRATHARQRSKTIDIAPAPTQPPISDEMGHDQSRVAQQERLANEKQYKPTEPVAVPTTADGAPRYDHSINPSGPPQDPYRIPPSQTQRPPRLPLPIGEELHTPGSPIISPQDLSLDFDQDAVEGSLPRKTSLLSSTTMGDDDDDDDQPLSEESVTKTIPTYLAWHRGGQKVYVTGTFANWNRKFRLHKHSSNENILSAVVGLPPGTHHLKFIVDGDMKTSDDLPTAVDLANILVNYIEVSADDIPPDQPSQPIDIQKTHPPPGVHPPHALPPPPEVERQTAPRKQSEETSTQPTVKVVPPRNYGKGMPKYLSELDTPEDSPQYQHAANEIGNTPSPPSLPLFLGKSILNNTSLMKDDASVLNYPNHTILNHLATSSIKDGILATSATTRYKRKYVSTILYKPTSAEE